jgi:hypothetical protein
MTATFLSLLMFVSFILVSHETLVPMRVSDRCAWGRSLRERCGRVLGQERHKFGVDPLGARPGYAVRTAFDLHVLTFLIIFA